MSEILTIRTSFADIAELADGYVDRVSADQLTLPAAEPVEEGEWSQFMVALSDGTPAFAGVGCCAEVTDMGTDAPPEARYELVLDTLRFEEDSKAVFEHLVMVSEATRRSPSLGVGAYPDEVHTADVSDSEVQELRGVQAEAAPAPEDIPDVGESDLEDFEAEQPVQMDAAQELAPEQFGVDESMPSDGPAGPEPVTVWPDSLKETILSRPLAAGTWMPQIGAPPEPRASSGLFQYNGDGLPQPPKPPRPELDPGLWVNPAPHPRDPQPAVRAAETPQPPSADEPAAEASPSIPVELGTAEYVAPAAEEAPADLAADDMLEGEQPDEPPPVDDQASDAEFPAEGGTAELAESELEELVEHEEVEDPEGPKTE